MTDADDPLLEGIRAGDADALTEFIELRRPQLLAFIERNLSDALRRKVEAQDILQEASLSAYNSLGEIDFTQRAPFGWLCHLAERRIIDAHRKFFGTQKRDAGREVGLGSPGPDTQRAGLIDVLVASMTTPSQAFSRDQREFRLLEALQELPEESRTALKLRYVDGLPSKEIAEQVGKSNGAVRVLLSRSLAKLQQILDRDPHFKPPE